MILASACSSTRDLGYYTDMTNEKATADTKSEPKTSSPAGAPASESGDPAVQQLLAERQTAVMNGDDTKHVDEQLVKLGFTEYR